MIRTKLFFFAGLLIFLCFSLTACENPKKEKSDMITEKEYSILALGDSYTIGESVLEKERWPVQLADSLQALGYKIKEPLIIAKTGWTTDELNSAITKASVSDTFDFVFLLIGVNNQYRGRDIPVFRTEFIDLLNQAITFANGNLSNVFVISIPDWGVMPFAANRDRQKIASEIDSFNAVKKEESLKQNVTFIDITPISRKAATDLNLVANDGLHPSGKMYAEWVKLILPNIRTRL